MNTPSLTLTSSSDLAVVLVEPRIPQNVGNIGRLCACTGSRLILVGDLGFSFDEKYLKRAGMDYLEHVQPEHYPDFPDVLADNPGWTYSFYSSKAARGYTEAPFVRRHLLVFGSETQGLPPVITQKYGHLAFRIPMIAERRSLNLATSTGIVLYEALRQLNHWPAGGELETAAPLAVE